MVAPFLLAPIDDQLGKSPREGLSRIGKSDIQYRIQTPPLAGLLMVKQSAPVGMVIDDLILIWSTSEAEEWQTVVSFLPL